MNALAGFLLLAALPIAIGAALPRPVRLPAALLTATAALVLLARGLNVHGLSMLIFMVSAALAIGALSRVGVERLPRAARAAIGLLGAALAAWMLVLLPDSAEAGDLWFFAGSVGLGIALSAAWIELSALARRGGERKAVEHG